MHDIAFYGVLGVQMVRNQCQKNLMLRCELYWMCLGAVVSRKERSLPEPRTFTLLAKKNSTRGDAGGARGGRGLRHRRGGAGGPADQRARGRPGRRLCLHYVEERGRE